MKALPLALMCAIAATAIADAAPRRWTLQSSARTGCWVKVRGKTVVETSRGTVICRANRDQLGCLWTHVNGFYQEAWRIDLRTRKVTPIATFPWDSGLVIKSLAWSRGRLMFELPRPLTLGRITCEPRIGNPEAVWRAPGACARTSLSSPSF